MRWILFLVLLTACSVEAQVLEVCPDPPAPRQVETVMRRLGAEPGPCFRFAPRENIPADSLPALIIASLEQAGYLAASMRQNADAKGDTLRYWLDSGPEIRWIHLEAAGPLEAEWMKRARINPDKMATHEHAVRIRETLMAELENNGYPFASIQWDSLRILPSGEASALVRIRPGPFVRFGDIRVFGDLELPDNYWPPYLGIRTGDAYSRKKVIRTRDRLLELPFAEPSANPSVRFVGDEAHLQLYLQKKRSGRFDFILGLLPQPDATDGRLLITGSLDAAFQNALNLGEKISLSLERLRPDNQELQIQAEYPFAAGLPIILSAQLNVFRRDSAWVDANGDLGLQYVLDNGAVFSGFWHTGRSFLQTIDTALVLQTRQLPPFPDLTKNTFGLKVAMQRLDNRYSPRRGWLASAEASAGVLTVNPNSQIQGLEDPADPGFDFSNLYDTVRLKRSRYQIGLQAERYFPVFVRSTLKIKIQGAGIFSETPVFNNEQFRLGGNKLLRGFNEESLFATRWLLGTLEYRLLTGGNSYFSLFADIGYLENVTNRLRIYQRPIGLGAGILLDTGAGLFGLSLAFGKPDTRDAFDLRAAKFHIGYINIL